MDVKLTDIEIPVDCFEEVEVKEENSEESRKMLRISGVNMFDMMQVLWKDKYIKEFLDNEDVMDMFARRMGVEGLLKSYDKTEVCDAITWDYIREYFKDHVDASEILDHIGWETVSKHFADYIDDENTSAEDINTTESVAEKLNVGQGQD